MAYPVPSSTRFMSVTLDAGDTAIDLSVGGDAPFPVVEAIDLMVSRQRAGAEQPLTLDVDYAVSSLGQLPGAWITLAQPALQGDVIIVVGERTIQRKTDLYDGQRFNDLTLNSEFDNLTIQQQELRRDVDRAWKAGYGDKGGLISRLPDGHFWKSDAAGNMIDGGSAEDIKNAEGYAQSARQDAESAKEDADRAEDARLNAQLYDPTYRYKTVTALKATLRAPGGTGTRWQAAGYLYDEAAPDATDHHVETAGGVKLYAVADKGCIYPEQLGAAADGVTDDAEIIRRTRTVAAAMNVRWQLNRRHRVDSTVFVGSEGLRSAVGGTDVYTAISDGSAVFEWLPGSIFSVTSDVTVHGVGFNFAQYLLGLSPAINAIGFKYGNAGATFVNRVYLENTHVSGLAVGYDLSGFIISSSNVWANACDIGFRGYINNSADLNLRLENCKKSFELVGNTSTVGAVLLRQLLDEGAKVDAVASTIDGCHAVILQAPYWEGTLPASRSQPYLKVGYTKACQDVRIEGMNLAAYTNDGVAALAFDEVDGLEISGWSTMNAYRPTIETTQRVRNFRKYDVFERSSPASSPWLTEDSRNVATSWNYFPNRGFDAWFRGWATVAFTRCVGTKETSNVRRGLNAVRLTATSGQNFNSAMWTLAAEALTALRGKKVRMGAWIYVPPLAEFSNVSGRTALPSIQITSTNGTSTVTSPTRNTNAVAGHWQFFWAEVEMQADATQVQISVNINQSATAASGNEYLIVDEITVCETAVPMSRQMAGAVIDHPSLPAFIGGRMHAYAENTPTSAAQQYVIGDTIHRSNAGAGAVPGWICTTAGDGTTAVWKAMAVLAA